MRKRRVELPKITFDEMLENLANQEISVENIMNVAEAEFILGRHGQLEAVRLAEKRFQKYMEKRGFELPPLAQESMRKNIHANAYLEVAVRKIIGKFGVAGARVIDYMRLARRVSSIVHRKPYNAWVKHIKNTINYWVEFYDCDPKIAYIVALVSAKIAYDIWHS